MDREGIVTRKFVSANGNRAWGDCPFSIGHLRSILQNPIYVGEIRHKGERFPGQHEAIVTTEAFDRVQALIASRSRKHRLRIDAGHVNVLAGLLVDVHGNKLTSAHTSKQGRRYRYYLISADGNPTGKKSNQRIPAGDIETLATNTLAQKLSDRSWVFSNMTDAGSSPDVRDAAISAARNLSADLERATGAELGEILRQCCDRIIVGLASIAIHLRPSLTEQLHADSATDRGERSVRSEWRNPLGS